jgi:F0F1-type ATP synthase membrane subunit c/vacuolar-type H+-ATPase subunit K
LALCQRYCYKVTSAGGTDGYVRYVLGESLSVSSIEAVVPLPVQMRVTPSLTTPVATQFAAYTTGTIISLTTINIVYGSAVNTAGIGAAVASGLTAGRAVQVMSNNNNTSYLLFSSEL